MGLFFVVSTLSCTSKKESQKTPLQNIEASYRAHLDSAILFLDSLQQEKRWEQKRLFFLQARRHFKYAEPVMAFLDVENYTTLNGPNLLKVHEEDATDVKVKSPNGFQVIEENLFAESPDSISINHEAMQTAGRLRLVLNTTNFHNKEDYHFLWILKDAFIRVALTGITGFDSPALENSLQEAVWVNNSLRAYLDFYQSRFTNQSLYQSWVEVLTKANDMLLNGDFSSFDRYSYIKDITHKELNLWQLTVQDWEVEFPFDRVWNNEASSLFSRQTFNEEFFTDPMMGVASADRVALGKKLFAETGLSKSGEMSCAACHQQDKAFTDGLRVFPKQTRNTPSLPYTHYQKAFFYDNRAGSLEGQITFVLENEHEFHSSFEEMLSFVSKTEEYKTAFDSLYEQGANALTVRNAIASYVRSLAPFNSKFDANISGLRDDLTESEKNGFNLFTGKAKCATCHFAPLFHGTVPVAYRETELESIGVPDKADTANATLDSDVGRYAVFNTEERKFFFKTPTVRNVEFTAPYMHNGVYKTLEEVVDFYNRGGGAGIGIELENQTLPSDPLNLSEQEKADLVAFMKSLSDAGY
ncbi:MAG: cytochrome-c peroxidase [Luteibaculum sp.]